MIELKGLSFTQNKTYQHAIRRGYFEGYEQNARTWRHSFVGSFIWKYPERTKVLDMLSELAGHKPEWEDIDDDFLRDFVAELEQQKLKPSSRRTMCAELKAVINSNAGKTRTKDFMKILTLKNSVSQAVYLTMDEMEKILAYTPVTSTETFVWRNFCVCMLTGARLSDAVNLSINNCDADTGMLRYVPVKTPNIIVNVPVDERHDLRNILSIRDGRECCLDTFNEFIRKICKEVGVVKMSSITRSEVLITKEKWELVSSHTARRSFATNLYLSGVALEDIALMMGHGKNIETTKRYICGERQITTRVMAYFLPEDRHKESEEYMRAYNDAITDSLQVIDDYLGLPDDNLAVLAIKGLQKI